MPVEVLTVILGLAWKCILGWCAVRFFLDRMEEGIVTLYADAGPDFILWMQRNWPTDSNPINQIRSRALMLAQRDGYNGL